MGDNKKNPHFINFSKIENVKVNFKSTITFIKAFQLQDVGKLSGMI